MRNTYHCGQPTTVHWSLAFVLLLSVPVTFLSCDNPYLYRMSANVNFQNFSIEDDDDDDHEGNNKSNNLFTFRPAQSVYPSRLSSFNVAGLENVRRIRRSAGRNYRTSMQKLCGNDSVHILHRTKKIKRWNTYHQNRFKRSTTVEHFSSLQHYRNLLNVTPNVSIDYVTRGPMEGHFGDERHLLGVTPQPVYLIERYQRSKRNNMSSLSRRLKWPIKRVVKVEGDVIIGALMMVHSRGASDQLCGPIMPQGGVQALEVMLYTLQEINKKPDMPFRIGAHILDDCDTDTYGLEMALDFIKANLQNLDDNLNKSECSSYVSKPIWGVVGAPSSITSIQVANLLRLFNIPMISPFSTSPELSNKGKFDYFCRTIPADTYQVLAIAGIIDRLQWTYVSVIYEESNYGIKGLEELEKVLGQRKVCIAIKEKVLKDSGVPTEEFFDKVVEKLLTKPLAIGVIVFASDQEVAGIMSAVKRLNQTRRFSWIGSDGWSARNLVSEGNEEVVEGTISVQPLANPVKGFDKYFFNRSSLDKVNPYFAEYLETVFQCRLPSVPETPFNKDFKEKCHLNESLDPHTVELENQLQFVHQATCGFSNALINMHTDLCGANVTGICDRMLQGRGALFLKYIQNVTFTDFSGDEFRFDENCDGPARYNIVHYKQTSPGVYKWIRVGHFKKNRLDLKVEELQFKLNEPAMPVSSCSQTCMKGEMKKFINGDKCCWKCLACAKYEVVTPQDETECKKCDLGTQPDKDRKACFEVTSVVKRSEIFQYAIIGSTLFGFFNVLAVFILYTYNFNSAIVRASSREAQVLILIGAVILHANAYSFLLDPNEVVCSMQSYLSGLGYVLIYGTLFWKSYRIVRIFDLNAQYKNLNSSAFVLLVLGLCCIQKILSVVWTYFVDPRKATYVYPTRDTKIKLCSLFTTVEMGHFIGLIFPLTSIVLCYFRTKKITNTPKIFDDSRQIFFCIRFTILSWITLFIIQFTTSDTLFRQSVLAIVTNLNGCVVIFALFYRSIFIILFRPQMNTREYLRASRANHTMKSQQVDDFSHTRENYSQCMMNEFSYSAEENPISKRDVSIQYSNSICSSSKSNKQTHAKSSGSEQRKLSSGNSNRSLSVSESISNGTSKSVNVDSNGNTIKSSPCDSEEDVKYDSRYGLNSSTPEDMFDIIVQGKRLDDAVDTSWTSISVGDTSAPLENHQEICPKKIDFINRMSKRHFVNCVQSDTQAAKPDSLSDENSLSETMV